MKMGLLGFLMIFFSLAQGAITGAVIGTNSSSKFMGVFGVILMIIAIVVDRYEIEHK